MVRFDHKVLGENVDLLAPDGSAVRLLTQVDGGSMAHFTLEPGQTSKAVTHRTVEEVWFILSGEGEMWRRQNEHDDVIALHAGVSLTIPLGTDFQFRNKGSQPLTFILVTMPPWPGPDEAIHVEDHWPVS